MEIEKIAAMAIAAIMEETKSDAFNIRIKSFIEIPKSSLQQYIADHNIKYHKYRLGDREDE